MVYLMEYYSYNRIHIIEKRFYYEHNKRNKWKVSSEWK